MGNLQTGTTLENIHKAALHEFQEKGFRSASLRQIARDAGVTTGALYGYYPSKEALFEGLVDEQYRFLMDRYTQAQDEFAALPPEEQPESLTRAAGDCMHEILLYMYEHLPQFKLLLCCSSGTRYENLVEEMAEIERRGTDKYLEVLAQLGRPAPPIDERLEHILITGMLNAYWELVIHEMPLEQAQAYLNQMRAFYTAGWMELMGQ